MSEPMATVSQLHSTTVESAPFFCSRARCRSCGWQGDVRATAEEAADDAQRHRDEATA